VLAIDRAKIHSIFFFGVRSISVADRIDRIKSSMGNAYRVSFDRIQFVDRVGDRSTKNSLARLTGAICYAAGKANSLTIIPKEAAKIIPPNVHKRVSCLSIFFSTSINLVSITSIFLSSPLISVLTSSIFLSSPKIRSLISRISVSVACVMVLVNIFALRISASSIASKYLYFKRLNRRSDRINATRSKLSRSSISSIIRPS
jgi:hypothetical protein